MPGKPLHLTDKYDKMSVESFGSPRFFNRYNTRRECRPRHSDRRRRQFGTFAGFARRNAGDGVPYELFSVFGSPHMR